MSGSQGQYSTSARIKMEENLLKLFAFTDETLSAEREIDARVSDFIQKFLRSTEVSSIEFGALEEAFKDSTIPAQHWRSLSSASSMGV